MDCIDHQWMDLEVQVALNEKVYASSKLSHILDNSPLPLADPNDNEQKHLKLLDGIALLLVTAKSGDVAAVTFEQSPLEILVTCAKNTPCEESLSKYIASVLQILPEIPSHKSDVLTTASKITMIAAKQCELKLRYRISKIAKESNLPPPRDIAF